MNFAAKLYKFIHFISLTLHDGAKLSTHFITSQLITTISRDISKFTFYQISKVSKFQCEIKRVQGCFTYANSKLIWPPLWSMVLQHFISRFCSFAWAGNCSSPAWKNSFFYYFSEGLQQYSTAQSADNLLFAT